MSDHAPPVFRPALIVRSSGQVRGRDFSIDAGFGRRDSDMHHPWRGSSGSTFTPDGSLPKVLNNDPRNITEFWLDHA
jgi:hypothetical protein